ncbi:hypothetical protein L289_1043 [Acinetobacter gerneri DSM 14967 = CIP 107464 = MTCC 9824]|nr:hypothetical protein L289_1043 [Acinetobacter gerneri DSM 14967 = CIP 107464 = MTCC 9824]
MDVESAKILLENAHKNALEISVNVKFSLGLKSFNISIASLF